MHGSTKFKCRITTFLTLCLSRGADSFIETLRFNFYFENGTKHEVSILKYSKGDILKSWSPSFLYSKCNWSVTVLHIEQLADCAGKFGRTENSQWVQRLATRWTVRVSNHSGGKVFSLRHTNPHQPCGPHPASSTKDTEVLSWVWRDRGVAWTTHHILAPRLWMGNGYTSLSPLRLHSMLPFTHKRYVTTTGNRFIFVIHRDGFSRDLLKFRKCFW